MVSVTEVLAKYQDFSMVNPERLGLAKRRGQAVHAYCRAYAQGLWVPVGGELEGYCKSFRDWFDRYVAEVYLTEKELIDPVLGFCGHPDLLCRLHGDDCVTIVDYKTPIALAPTWAAQCAAYLSLAQQDPHIAILKPKRCGSLRLKPDGKRALFKEYTESARDLLAFHAALTAHKYFMKGE